MLAVSQGDWRRCEGREVIYGESVHVNTSLKPQERTSVSNEDLAIA